MGDSLVIIFDAHLDLAWNAIDWNRDLRLPVERIRQVEKEAGMTDKGRGEGTEMVCHTKTAARRPPRPSTSNGAAAEGAGRPEWEQKFPKREVAYAARAL